MAIYRVGESSLTKVEQTSFAEERVLERRDLQRLLRQDISVLGPDLMVVAEEYSEWEDSDRRIDLLCLDRQARLVVVELKRGADGGHMELQAIRYAAMVSGMTFDQLVDAHTSFLGGDNARGQAEAAILAFLGWQSPSEAAMKEDVRILLASGDFSKELTTSVLWLNKQGLDVTCIRMQPYRLDGQVLVDVQQIIPLREAEEYETKIRAQHQESRRAESENQAMFRRFWAQVIDRSREKTPLLAGRRTTSGYWLGISQSGLVFNFVLLKDEWRVECYIDFGKDSEERNLAAFKFLQGRQSTIEQAFGAQLDWQELEDSRACRICMTAPSGWRTPESEWPTLQDKMIDAMVRLEGAFRDPIRALRTEHA